MLLCGTTVKPVVSSSKFGCGSWCLQGVAVGAGCAAPVDACLGVLECWVFIFEVLAGVRVGFFGVLRFLLA